MDDGTPFITLEEQCPRKPRGRKPKQGKGAPSAAALGFDTVGLSEKEIEQAASSKEGPPKRQRKTGQVEDEHGAPTKKKPRGKSTAADTSTHSKRNSIPSEPAEDDKPSKRTRKSSKKGETIPSEPAEDDKPSKRTRKSSKKGETNTSEPAEDDKPCKKARKTSKKDETIPSEPAEDDQPCKKPRKASKKDETIPNEPAEDDQPCKKPRKASKHASMEDETKVETGKGSGAKSKGKTTKKTAAGAPPPPPPGHDESEVDKAAKKARYSRKSAAYHRARKLAKDNGESIEAQIAAGKKAARFKLKKNFCAGACSHFVLSLCSCVFHMREILGICGVHVSVMSWDHLSHIIFRGLPVGALALCSTKSCWVWILMDLTWIWTYAW